MDGCITIAGWILLIVGIILCVVGYNTLNGLLLLIGIAAVAVGVGLTFWLAALLPPQLRRTLHRGVLDSLAGLLLHNLRTLPWVVRLWPPPSNEKKKES